jgi:hypothetical protein
MISYIYFLLLLGERLFIFALEASIQGVRGNTFNEFRTLIPWPKTAFVVKSIQEQAICCLLCSSGFAGCNNDFTCMRFRMDVNERLDFFERRSLMDLGSIPCRSLEGFGVALRWRWCRENNVCPRQCTQISIRYRSIISIVSIRVKIKSM